VSCLDDLPGLFRECNAFAEQMKYIKRAQHRVQEAVFVSASVSFVAFALPCIMRCSDIPSQGSYVNNSLRSLNCPEGKYSGAAVLFFNPAEQAIKVLAIWSVSLSTLIRSSTFSTRQSPSTYRPCWPS
jgi:hypothetical protein